MMIMWEGKNCSDGCPFYEVSRSAIGTMSTWYNPKCRLSGHRDESGGVLDIQPTLINKGWDNTAMRPENCPFADVHGIHVEVHNND